MFLRLEQRFNVESENDMETTAWTEPFYSFSGQTRRIQIYLDYDPRSRRFSLESSCDLLSQSFSCLLSEWNFLFFAQMKAQDTQAVQIALKDAPIIFQSVVEWD